MVYIAPEIIRGNNQLVRDRNLDLYACGMAALFALFQVNRGQSPWQLLELAAAGTLFRKDRVASRLPFWMDRVDHYSETCRQVSAALDPDPRQRGAVDPVLLAETIDLLADYTDPLKTVRELRQKKAGEQALQFIEDVCLRENYWELLAAAAEIAGQDLNRAVEGIDFYERAIQLRPHDRELMAAQLSLLLDNVPAVFIQALKDRAVGAGDRLDRMAWRDFHVLPETEQKRLARGAATYFMRRKKFTPAAEIIYRHLFDGDIFMWWEVDLALLYVHALAGLRKYGDAEKFLNGTRKSLSRLRAFPPGDPRALPEREIAALGGRIVELDRLLKEESRRHGQAGFPGGTSREAGGS